MLYILYKEFHKMKKCLKCGESKPFDQYAVSKNSPDGLHSYCRSCNNIRLTEYQKNNLDHVRRLERERYHKDKEKYALKMQGFYQHKRMTDPSYVLWRNAKVRAKAKGLPFNIEKEDIVIPTHCPVLGMPFSYTNKRGFCEDSPTVDRIIPKLGYVKGNIIVISWRANKIKSDSSVEELGKVFSFFNDLLQSKL